MTDKDLKTIFEKIESLHEKILKSRFAETVTESEMISLILAVRFLSEQQAEIERLKCEMGKLLPKDCAYAVQMEVSNKLETQIRAKAVKEFAERLKNKSLTKWDYHDAVDVDEIDNLVKEMTGDTA